MPLGPASHEFWPECNVAVFTRKLVGSIYIGQRNKKKILLKTKKKKTSGKFCTKIPLCLSVQKFRSKCNVTIFTWKHAGRIYIGPRNKQKIL